MTAHMRSQLVGVREIRNVVLTPTDVEERKVGDTAEFVLRGCASVTGVAYEVTDALGSYMETVERGAFKTTLGENPEVAFLIEHQGLPLASTRAGTMRLWESERGLEVYASLDVSNPMSRQVISGILRGDITEMSYAFRAVLQQWNEDWSERLLRGVNLHRGDVSVVTYGANPATSVDREHDDGDDDGHDGDGDDGDGYEALLLQQQQEEMLGIMVAPEVWG